jgi:hypothetical protein
VVVKTSSARLPHFSIFSPLARMLQMLRCGRLACSARSVEAHDHHERIICKVKGFSKAPGPCPAWKLLLAQALPSTRTASKLASLEHHTSASLGLLTWSTPPLLAGPAHADDVVIQAASLHGSVHHVLLTAAHSDLNPAFLDCCCDSAALGTQAMLGTQCMSYMG